MNHHAPGPWHVDEDNVDIVLDDDGIRVTATCGGNRARRIANAQLIVAAPDMLNVLKRIIDCGLLDPRDAGFDRAAFLAAQAIAKAKGVSHE